MIPNPAYKGPWRPKVLYEETLNLSVYFYFFSIGVNFHDTGRESRTRITRGNGRFLILIIQVLFFTFDLLLNCHYQIEST